MKKITLQDLNSAVATAKRNPLNTGAARPVVRKAEEVEKTAVDNLRGAKWVCSEAWKEKEALKKQAVSVEKGQFESWMNDLFKGKGATFTSKADLVQRCEIGDYSAKDLMLKNRRGDMYEISVEDLHRAYNCFLADVQKQQISAARKTATGKFLHMQKEVIVRDNTLEEAKKQNNFEKIILREVIPQDYKILLKQERTALDSLVTMGEALVEKA